MLLQPARHSLLSRVCLQAEIFGNGLASINAVEGEHQLETSCFSSLLRRVWDLKGKLYKASGTKHRLAPLLHLGFTPAKMVTESVKHNSRSPSLRNTIQKWQACSLTKSTSGHSERTTGHHNHSTLSHLHKSGQTKLLIPTGSTGYSCETWFLISAPRQKGVTRVIYTDKQAIAMSNYVFSLALPAVLAQSTQLRSCRVVNTAWREIHPHHDISGTADSHMVIFLATESKPLEML